MKTLICTVYDRIAQNYGTPIFTLSKGSTIRAFSDQINRPDKDNQLYQHPDDFDLYFLGTFDDSSAKFEMLEQSELLARGANVKIIKPTQE